MKTHVWYTKNMAHGAPASHTRVAWLTPLAFFIQVTPPQFNSLPSNFHLLQGELKSN